MKCINTYILDGYQRGESPVLEQDKGKDHEKERISWSLKESL